LRLPLIANLNVARRRGPAALLLTVTMAVAELAGAGVPARATPAVTFSKDIRFTASDGVSLQTTLTGSGAPSARPVVVEFSPYGRNSGTFQPGTDYNFLLVQIRGTGDSDGVFDALGPRTQADVAEVLQWACHAPWSDGNLALNGFSASAIVVYNSMHLHLPCVRAATLKSGTFDLYRDLLWPGGVSNTIPGLGVLALIGAPALAQGLTRLQRNPASSLAIALGLIGAGVDGGLVHPTLDSWWQARRFQGAADHFPILMIDGFFDVESRGAFQAFQALQSDGDHLLVVGGHDGAPAGTDDGRGEMGSWLDHYVRGVANGVESHPAVQMLLAHGDRLSYLAGQDVRRDASGWPVPGTQWIPMYLTPGGALVSARPAASVTQSYLGVPSDTFMTDPPNTAILGADGVNSLGISLPITERMNVAEILGLSYTTAPFAHATTIAGPLDLDMHFASTAGEAALWAVISDVWPDGSAHPLTVGRLLDDYPGIDPARSLYQGGRLVQPYGVYSSSTPPAIAQDRLYHVEFWPIGNRFEAGHRLRLDLVGPSAASRPDIPGVDRIVVGGRDGGVLEVPVLPG
jgi:hypothetical protein